MTGIIEVYVIQYIFYTWRYLQLYKIHSASYFSGKINVLKRRRIVVVLLLYCRLNNYDDRVRFIVSDRFIYIVYILYILYI